VPEVAAFGDFYRGVNGRAPFAWQSRLAELVIGTGWPPEIGVPTGLGKTSCLDIAVWALAQSAASGAQRLPTRTWYVVNRRLLVDAAWAHGKHLAKLLEDPSLAEQSRAAVASVATALGSLAGFGAQGGPCYVTRLRGGAEVGARPPDPSQPSLLFATVPMFASRWLFRGYGSSTTMRPVDAAHAGIDTLVLLDEAHLSRPLLQLVNDAAACDIGDPGAVVRGLRSRPVVVAMTATGETAGERFELDDADRADPVVSRRLHAPKQGQLVETTENELAEELARRALAVVNGQNDACVVFANTPRTARDVSGHLRSLSRRTSRDVDVMLVTGRVRDWEGDQIRERLLDPGMGLGSGSDKQLARPLVVVATQTLEVGADVDFDHMVTETAGVRSLVQRLGRLNRLGNRPHATCTVCHPAGSKRSHVYGEETEKVWARLQAARCAAGDLDLSPSNLSTIIGLPEDSPDRVGQLLPAHLWEWAKTTVPPAGEAPVELFFEGFAADADVSIVWRAHRPDNGLRMFPAVSSAEAVEVHLGEVRDVLEDRKVRRLAPDRASLETVGAAALSPGDVVVLAPEDGLYDEQGWAPGSKETVLDVSPFGSRNLLVRATALENLAPGCLAHVGILLDRLEEPSEDEAADEAGVVAELVATLKNCEPHPWLSRDKWLAFLDDLGTTVTRPVGSGNDIDRTPWVGPQRRERTWASAAVRSEAFEELSFTASSHVLHQHLGAVGEAAARLAKRLELPADLVLALRLAGEWHDLGKHDPRFQRWMSPDEPPSEPIAKSGQPRECWESARVLSGWPKGGRHELLSARLARSWLEQHSPACDTELVLHLVASHHGEGRPSVKVVEDPAPASVTAEIDGDSVSASGDLACPDWDQPRRFHSVCERYGVWGVALLEALLRQADFAVSGFADCGVTGVA